MSAAPSGTAFGLIALMMFVSGIGIPIMASLNAGLGQHLASPLAASTVLFGVGLLICGSVLVVVGPPTLQAFAATPRSLYFGAVFMAGYLVAITWAAPRVGVGNAVFFVLLGQLVAAAAIDHFGLFGALRTGITVRRAVGLAVMALGVYLAKKAR